MSKSGGFSMKRTVSAAAAVALAASGLFVSAAHAEDSTLYYGNIEQNKTGSLTIHKFESGSLVQDPNTMTAAEGDGQGDGIRGVTFKVHRLNVDLSTKEGWDKVTEQLVVPTNACDDQGGASYANFAGFEAMPGAQAYDETTAAGGTATFNALPVGAYLVCEAKTEPGAAFNKADQPVTVVTRSAPFVVTVPRPVKNGTAQNKGWIYDIHAYPKNTVTEAPKKAVTVDDNKWLMGTEEAVTYTITNKVPSLLADQHFAHYAVIDQHSSSLDAVKVTTVVVGGEKFSLTTDYTVDSTQNNFLVVNFTKVGLLKLEGKKNQNVVVTLSAKVATLPVGVVGTQGAGVVSNTAYVSVKTSPTEPGDDPETPVNPGVGGGSPTPKVPGDPVSKPSNVAKTTWGDLKIRKYDAASQTTGLKGATFEVYKPQDEAACRQAAKASTKYTTTDGGNAITSVVTAENGQVTVPGLFIDKADSADPDVERCYIVRETVAPIGYTLPTEEQRTFAVVVKAGQTADQVYDLEMSNTKVSVPALPLTGASGRVLLMVGGLALVLGSMGVVMVIRKRNAEA